MVKVLKKVQIMLIMNRKKVVGESSGNWMVQKCCQGCVLLMVVVLISDFGMFCRLVRKNRKLQEICFQIEVSMIRVMVWLLLSRLFYLMLRVCSVWDMMLMEGVSMNSYNMLVIVGVIVQGQISSVWQINVVLIIWLVNMVSIREMLMFSFVISIENIVVVWNEVRQVLFLSRFLKFCSFIYLVEMLKVLDCWNDCSSVCVVGQKKNIRMMIIWGVSSVQGSQLEWKMICFLEVIWVVGVGGWIELFSVLLINVLGGVVVKVVYRFQFLLVVLKCISNLLLCLIVLLSVFLVDFLLVQICFSFLFLIVWICMKLFRWMLCDWLVVLWIIWFMVMLVLGFCLQKFVFLVVLNEVSVIGR